jgi:hypothetical protein
LSTTSAYRDDVALVSLPVDQPAGREGGQERDVVRQDAELAGSTRSGHLLDLLVEEQPLGADDPESEAGSRHQAASFLAFSITSSIVPCM